MGVSDKPQENKEGPKTCCRAADSSVDKKWVIAGIQLRAPLKPLVLTVADHQDADDCSSTTPTSDGSRITSSKGCPPPPPPRKRKQPSRGCTASTKDFFCPPDLDSVFIRRHVS